MLRIALAALAAVLLGGPLAAQVPDSALIRRALRLHREVPLVDGHNDLPWEIRNRFGSSLDSADIGRSQPDLQTDIPRLRRGGVGGQFWSLWGRTAIAQREGPRYILEQIDLVRRIEERWPGTFVPARTADDIVRAHRQGRIASLLGMEGGDYIQNSIPALRQFYDLGVRYMTLTWNATLDWADAAMDSARHHGLTPFGVEIVREMNRLGMLVDLSHVSDSVMVQALRVSEAPVIFSHSSARALTDHARNVPDAVLRLLPRNGGLVMVNFYCHFTDPASSRWELERETAVRDLRRRLGPDSAAVRAGVGAWMADHPQPPRPSVRTVADHIEHIRDVAGVDHVGYGSDFDGIDCAPQGLEDVGDFPALTAELLRRGWSETDVKKVIGLNLLRVMRGAEVAARRLRRERGPSEARLTAAGGDR
jgi:membrane dipeptidase